MNCCRSEESREQRRINREINERIQRDKRYARKEIKLLLLGTGESGKSTFIKQMRIIHGQGFSVEDRKKFTALVYQNIFMGIQNLIQALDTLGLTHNIDPLVMAKSGLVMAVEYRTAKSLDPELAHTIKELWSHPDIQLCFKRRNEFQISDSASHFLDSLDRVMDKDYIPTEMDLLRARAPTSGILEYCFQLDKKLNFRMVDVGGQRSERRKWLHSFENVTSIIFLVAISEYDQKLMESAVQNRLEESRNLFIGINAFPGFEQASIILFLNKTDILEEKILYSHVVDYFPDFEGEKQNAEDAKRFIMEMFTSNEALKSKNIYTYFTCATDTNNIRNVFDAVKDTILQNNLIDYNLV